MAASRRKLAAPKRGKLGTKRACSTSCTFGSARSIRPSRSSLSVAISRRKRPMADETPVQRRKALTLLLADKPPMTLKAIAGELGRDQTSVWVDLDFLREKGVCVAVQDSEKHRRNGMPVMRWRLNTNPAEIGGDNG